MNEQHRADSPLRADDERFMRMAIAEARLGDRQPGAGEVGCVIVKDGRVLASGHNEAQLRNDPTAHAEIVSIRRLGQALRTMEFRGCTLYCTLQPCSMCAAACIWAKLSRVVYGAARSDVHRMYFDVEHLNAGDLIRDAYRGDIEITGGILREECAAFYYAPGDQPPPDRQSNL